MASPSRSWINFWLADDSSVLFWSIFFNGPLESWPASSLALASRVNAYNSSIDDASCLSVVSSEMGAAWVDLAVRNQPGNCAAAVTGWAQSATKATNTTWATDFTKIGLSNVAAPKVIARRVCSAFYQGA